MVFSHYFHAFWWQHPGIRLLLQVRDDRPQTSRHQNIWVNNVHVDGIFIYIIRYIYIIIIIIIIIYIYIHIIILHTMLIGEYLEYKMEADEEFMHLTNVGVPSLL